MTIDEQRARVWDRMRKECPRFTQNHDPFDDPFMVESLVLDDFIGWKPFQNARVMDAGSNVGIWTAFCALHGTFVHAYEADPVTFGTMCQMLQDTNLIASVHPRNLALWKETGFIHFQGDENLKVCKARNGAIQVVGKNVSEFAPSTIKVPCISFAEALGPERWDCVKMDIEGAEFEILLNTSPEVLSQIDHLHVEFHNGWADDVTYKKVLDKLHALFASKGYVNSEGRYDWAQFRNKAREIA